MSKHTPGPWSLREKPYAYQVVADVDGDTICIAEVGCPVVSDLDLANAKLIAASPDLLEALQMTLGYLGDESTWMEGEQILAFNIKAAINKATL